jgi:lipopolysaccharide export system permease protein
MIKKLHLYVLKEFLLAFFFGLIAFSTLLLLDRVFDLANIFLSNAASFFITLKLFIFLFPQILTTAIPMAVLFGVLIAYGELTEDNEITAMKSLGTNYKTLSMPVILFVSIISFLLLFFNHILSPLMYSGFKNIYEKILIQKPISHFNERTIINLAEYRLFANKLNKKNNTLSGLIVHKFENKKNNSPENILTQNSTSSWRMVAPLATIKFHKNKAQLVLYNGYWQKLSHSDMNSMLHMTFRSYRFLIHLNKDKVKRYSLTTHGMTSLQIFKAIKIYKKQNISTIEYEYQFWLRWIFAFAPLAFVLVAIPIGVMLGKNAKAIGFISSISIVLIYYTLLMLTTNLSTNVYVPISVLIWIPNIVIATIGTCLFVKMAKK